MRFISLLTLLALAACTSQGAGTDSDTDTTGTTGGTTDAGTGEPTTGAQAEDLNPYELGEHASQACRDAMTAAATFFAAVGDGDVAAARAAYEGSALQTFVQAGDAAQERSDDAAVLAALDAGDAPGAALAGGHVLTALTFQLRKNLSAVETGVEDKYAAWDDAHCIWDGALRDLAERAQNAKWAPAGDTIVADIDAAFEAGHAGIAGEVPATTIDDWRIPPAKQIIEKSIYRAAHRDVVEQAAIARTGDPVAAARALGEFGIIRDRIEGRNTPGIAEIEAMLTGDLSQISPEAIAFELDIAFAKRTRNYADQAFGEGLGIPSSYKGAVEGRTYAKLITAGMSFAKIDTAAYLADWEAYVEHVRTGADEAAAKEVSQRIIDTTCAYQVDVLKIATCTGSDDEPTP